MAIVIDEPQFFYDRNDAIRYAAEQKETGVWTGIAVGVLGTLFVIGCLIYAI